MKYGIYLLLLLFFSCKKNNDEPTTSTATTPFTQIRQTSIRQPDSPLGQVFHDPNTNKDVLVFGTKNSSGFLKTIRFILVADQTTKDWILYELNTDYLPVWARLSKGYTLGYTNYDLTKQTVTLTGYQTDTRAKLGSVDNSPIDKNALDWANTAKMLLGQDIRQGRLAAECDKSKYNAAAAGYFAVNAAGCALGISEFGTGAGIPLAILSAYNTYQNCKSALDVLKNWATGQPPIGCPSAQDFGNNGLSCLEGELNAFSGNPYNFVQSCASGILANAAAAANCNCDPAEPKSPARSTGDPHLRTLDELFYDFQAYGEFVALKSTTDNFEIQARQQDVYNTGIATLNTGVAIRMGNDVVSVLIKPNRLYINNVLKTDPFTQLTLSNGTTLTKDGDDLTLTNAQKDQVIVRWKGDDYLLDYLVKLNPARAGKVAGILGNFDDNPDNDIALSTGEAVARSTDILNGRYADSWRIQQAQSLFVYEPGKTTESYTDRNFPRAKVNLTDDRKKWAEGVCRNAGVTNPDYLQDCIYDVAITGDVQMTRSAAWGQKADGVVPALPLPANSDFNQFLNVRLEIAPKQDDPDQLSLIDFDAGKVFKLRDGAANAASIDAAGSQYCGSLLSTPFTLKTCDISCGTSITWQTIKAQNWSVLQKGDLTYMANAYDSTYNVPVNQWNTIQSVANLKSVLKANLNKDDEFSYADIEDGGNSLETTCIPTYPKNKFIFAFITGQGKLGLFRITANGSTAEGRRWYTLDIKVQK